MVLAAGNLYLPSMLHAAQAGLNRSGRLSCASNANLISTGAVPAWAAEASPHTRNPPATPPAAVL